MILQDMQERQEKRERAFFERHGIDRATIEEATKEWEKTIDVEVKHGNRFYNSPMSRKSFVLGWAKRGRKD